MIADSDRTAISRQEPGPAARIAERRTVKNGQQNPGANLLVY